MKYSRRGFINSVGMMAAGYGMSNLLPAAGLFNDYVFDFEISLAQFSFASELYTGKMTTFDFPKRAVNEFGIQVVEYVSGFFFNKHTDATYLKELKNICDGLGVKNHLIMVDGENIASLDPAARKKAVESHYPWIDAAKYLGCTSIRVNLGDTAAAISGKGEAGSPEEAAKAAVDGYSSLLQYAEKAGLNVIVENHFGYSTNPDWLVGIIKEIKSDKKGLLPDFGNFCAQRTKPAGTDLKSLLSTKCIQEHDKYDGVTKLMPYAKGVSAKTHKFDAEGNDPETDFLRMFKIIKDSGWNGGIVGIEYEGGLMRDMGGDMNYLSNADGVKVTKKLLEKVRLELK